MTLPEDIVEPHPQTSVERVDPETAELWLGKNLRNRNLRAQSVVAAYARDMESGNWRFTGDTIKFTADGQLLDGQHRLHAIIRAGVTVPLLVVRNVEMEAQQVMDSGAVRRASDALDLEGSKNSKLLASAATAVLTKCGATRGNSKVTHSEILDILDSDSSIEWVVNEILPGLQLNRVMSPTVAFYTYWRCHGVAAEPAFEFFTSLSDLVNLPDGSPILALYNRLTKETEGRAAGRSSWRYRLVTQSCVFSAWNAWREGRELRRIVVGAEASGRTRIPDPK